MINELLAYVQNDLGKGAAPEAQSWSESVLGSLHFWSLLEGTHLLTLMLFGGTILMVDLRLLGVLFKTTPISVVERKILPLTIFGFPLMLVTGMALFFAKPVTYYHNVWFRAKMILLFLALLNIALFHFWVQRDQAKWDAALKPPLNVRASAFASLTLWILVICMGRFIAYSWFDCGTPQSSFINAVQSCAASEKGAISLGAP